MKESNRSSGNTSRPTFELSIDKKKYSGIWPQKQKYHKGKGKSMMVRKNLTAVNS